MNTTLAAFPQLNKGFPFLNGRWVGPTQAAAPPVVPFAPVPNDTVSLSNQAASLQSDEVMSGCLTVKADGKGVSQLLLDRGFSLEEMQKKDEHGLNLIDRTVAANNLKDRNLILPGQELSIPFKACAEGQDETLNAQSEPCSDEDQIVYYNDEIGLDDFEDPDDHQDQLEPCGCVEESLSDYETAYGDFDDQSESWPLPLAYIAQSYSNIGIPFFENRQETGYGNYADPSQDSVQLSLSAYDEVYAEGPEEGADSQKLSWFSDIF